MNYAIYTSERLCSKYAGPRENFPPTVVSWCAKCQENHAFNLRQQVIADSSSRVKGFLSWASAIFSAEDEIVLD